MEIRRLGRERECSTVSNMVEKSSKAKRKKKERRREVKQGKDLRGVYSPYRGCLVTKKIDY